MAGNELMELGRLVVESELDVLYIKDIRVEEAVNEHGFLELLFLSGRKLTPVDVIRCQGTPVRVATMDGDPVFAGICKSITLHGGNDYMEASLKAYTPSILADQEKKSRTFQAEQKTLDGELKEGIGAKATVQRRWCLRMRISKFRKCCPRSRRRTGRFAGASQTSIRNRYL